MTSSATRTVLVPLDGSKIAENAIPLAGLLGRVFDCDVRFIEVAPDHTPAGERGHAAEIFKGYALGRAEHFGIPAKRATADLLFGDASSVILSESKRDDSVALALATHGRGGFRATLFGSVADRVIHGAQVPVLVVPGVGGPHTQVEKVLVTLDGSATAEQALAPARAIAAAAHAEMILLRGFSIVPPAAVGYVYYPPEIPDAIIDEARSYVTGQARPGERALAVQGEAGAVICSVINDLDVDLVVMSKTGKRLAARVAMGSITDRVLHTAHRPTLVIPPVGRGGRRGLTV
ncbi:MAG TPA: universal stress protein [Tepidiformaceae bacterium]|nr:universal stress protein [Tepidiformaceae bacterium]